MHAERLEAQRRLALESDQNELDRVMLASLSTAAFDETLRDILCWIRDLQGACDAVAAALEEVAALRASLEDQEAGTSDDSSLARALWLSEQYERVAGRLRDLGRRLEPIEEAVAAFRSLEAYVRDSQPSKAETEEQRDAILAAMFEALSQQGLEAHHPFGAWGHGAQGEGYGSDLRGLVDGLIDEAKRIPMYPAFEEETQEPEAVPALEEAPLGPNLRTANVRRTPRQPVERRPEDAITRMPPLLPLRHQLDKDGWLGRLARVPAAAQGRADAPAPTAADVPVSELRDLGRRIQSAQLSTVQEVCDFVTSIVEESGAESAAALGVAGVAAAAAAGDASLWPRERWSAAAAVTRVCDELGDCVDRLAHWRVPAGATPAEERLRLLAVLESATRLTARVAHAHDALRQRLDRAGLPWDGAILEEARWGAQAAARAVATLGVQSVRGAGGGSWSAAQTLEPLVAAFDAAFAVHQFAQGLNRAAGEAVSELVRQTTHFARMVDPLWVRDTKWA